MADESAFDSPRPFRRERNLSNRNFAKRRSGRRISVESHSSVESFNLSAAESVNNASSASSAHENNSSAGGNDSHNHSTSSSSGSSGSHSFSVASSQLDYSYSVQSDTESAFYRASTRRMVPPPLPITGPPLDNDEPTTTTTNGDDGQPQTPDPALLGVRQKVNRFETLTAEQRILFKTGRHQLRQQNQQNNTHTRATTTTGVGGFSAASPGLWRVFPPATRRSTPETDSSVASRQSAASSFHTSIDEERSVDDVDEISDYAEDAQSHAAAVAEAEYVLPEEAHELREDAVPSPVPGYMPPTEHEQALSASVAELNFDDFGKVEKVRRAVSDDYARTMPKARAKKLVAEVECSGQIASKDFPRNFRSVPRPKTEIIGTKNHAVVDKCKSLYQPSEHEEETEAELRDKSSQHIKPILEELIKTEETYVENLRLGLENYGNIFARKDLPIGLRGKKYVLLGNIGQIYEFHAEEFLPMLHAYRRDLKRLFDEFQHYINNNSFYCYVIFTMNKQRSLKLCDTFKNYFKRIQNELDDKLGINSFLVQPIQRMARYPLLLQQFITTLFKHPDFEVKPLLESCCRLEKKMRTLLTTTNESEVINDIVECNEFNVFHQGKFRKVSDFSIIDHTLRRTYRGKVFIFDKCIIYTEIKGKHLIFHGRYPCEHIGILAKTKNFTLFYERRKQQECDFHAEPPVIEAWLELIREMVSSFAAEERQKLQDRYAREGEQQYRKPVSLTLFRDSNRFSSDSGIGNIWVLPKPEPESDASSNRTTWYAVN